MTAREVPQPILNSPYEQPAEHWRISELAPPERVAGRRLPMYWYRKPGKESADPDSPGTAIELLLVSRIRRRLDEWRPLALRGEGGVTRASMDLMRHWRRSDRRQRLFFAQLEAAETVIFLTEARPNFLQGITVPADEPDEEARASGVSAFRRYACKMATGAGKTTVMAMLAAWSILNKAANRGDSRYSDLVLVVCPNVTIRNRLEELKPERGEASLYRTRDLVPSESMGPLTTGQVIVTNWHIFEPRSGQAGGDSAAVVRTGKAVRVRETIRIGRRTTTQRGIRYLTLADYEARARAGLIEVRDERRDGSGHLLGAVIESTRHVESDHGVLRRVFPAGARGKRSVLVLNDEAHHAYRIRQSPSGEESGEESDEASEDLGDREAQTAFYRGATVWVDGLDRIHRRMGIVRCIDLSATPYYLGRVGQQANRPFPWVVSDFGLQDAIESGLVKIPQLAVRDSSGAPIPGYFNIWRWIQPMLTPAERGGKRGTVKPAAVLKYAHTPIAMLGGLWEELLAAWAERKDEDRPPVFIIVCRDTALAKVVYSWLAEDDGPVGIPSCHLGELRNENGEVRTIRVDSKVVRESDGGESRTDADRWMRHTLDTVGKTEWPRDFWRRTIYPEGFKDLADRLGRPTAHPPGRDIRCIVSVGMLTEGWDCNTVTHIIGLRPFRSQLLCEQVVGRGLRRSNYAAGDDGRLSEEVAKIFGVPFQVIPFKERDEEKDERGRDRARQTWRVHAVPEKSRYEIRFPRVEGYAQQIRGRIAFDWDSLAPLRIDPAAIPPEVDLKAAIPSSRGRPSVHGPGDLERADLRAFRESRRRREHIFELARDLTRHLLDRPECVVPAHSLFPEFVNAIERYSLERVEAGGGAKPIDVFLSPWYGLMAERLLEAILPLDKRGRPTEIPRYETGRGCGSTADVDFHTRRKPYPVDRSHLNAVVPDTERWEQSAAFQLDGHERVHSFVKNAGLGFAIPYLHNDETREYQPDFIARLNGGADRRLILETKGFDRLGQVKRQAAERWVRAVNADGRHGVWAYALVTDIGEVGAAVERAATDSPA